MQFTALLPMFLATSLTVTLSTAFGIERDSLTSQRVTTWKGHQRLPDPRSWPHVFNIQFYVYVEQYGSNWSSNGALHYNWTSKTFRGDFLKWCIPLFGSDLGSKEFNNYTCSFLATNGNMYFINHTAAVWEKNDCCLFQKGLGALTPDWMTLGEYNGTTTIRDTECDVWWFPGTNDPDKPCYSYWNVKGEQTPMRFFGLTSVGPTMLDYFDFKPDIIPSSIDMKLPNNTNCNKDCIPPQLELVQGAKMETSKMPPWPPSKWPKCE